MIGTVRGFCSGYRHRFAIDCSSASAERTASIFTVTELVQLNEAAVRSKKLCRLYSTIIIIIIVINFNCNLVGTR
jgi:hypothetical protein